MPYNLRPRRGAQQANPGNPPAAPQAAPATQRGGRGGGRGGRAARGGRGAGAARGAAAAPAPPAPAPAPARARRARRGARGAARGFRLLPPRPPPPNPQAPSIHTSSSSQSGSLSSHPSRQRSQRRSQRRSPLAPNLAGGIRRRVTHWRGNPLPKLGAPYWEDQGDERLGLIFPILPDEAEDNDNDDDDNGEAPSGSQSGSGDGPFSLNSYSSSSHNSDNAPPGPSRERRSRGPPPTQGQQPSAGNVDNLARLLDNNSNATMRPQADNQGNGGLKKQQPPGSYRTPAQGPAHSRITPPQAERQRRYDPRRALTIDEDIDGRFVSNPPPEDIEIWGERGARFLHSTDGYLGDGWTGHEVLGEGGFGIAGLWEKRKENQVVDKIVIKQIGEKQGWDPEFPNEVDMMQRMRRGNMDNVVKLEAYRRYRDSKVHRLYIEYCPNGDLAGLRSKYLLRSRHFPEAFLWDVFYGLAKACENMKSVIDLNDMDAGRPLRQEEIVHRDIKADNIFLADPISVDKGGMDQYPVVKLGDYGLAIKTGIRDPKNPHYYRGNGTPDYIPPESKSLRNRIKDGSVVEGTKEDSEDRRSAPKILAHSNIWGVGAVMYELIRHHMAMQARPKKYWPAVDPRHYTDPRIGVVRIRTLAPDASRYKYSRRLRSLVRHCLRPNPRHRPSLSTILKITKEEREKCKERWNENAENREKDRVYYTNQALNRMKTGNFKTDWRITYDGLEPTDSMKSGIPTNDEFHSKIWNLEVESEPDGSDIVSDTSAWSQD